MNEKKNNKLAMIGVLTITLSVLLMNVGRLEGVVPDWVVRVIGIAAMICTGLCVFFAVRELVKYSRDKGKSNKQTSEKE